MFMVGCDGGCGGSEGGEGDEGGEGGASGGDGGSGVGGGNMHVSQLTMQCLCMYTGLTSHSPSLAQPSHPLFESAHGRSGGREGGENGSQQPVQSQPRTSSSLHCSRPFRAPHVVARHPMSQLGVFSGIEGGCGGESGGTPGGEGSAEGGGGDGGCGDGEGGGGDGGLSGDGGGCIDGEGAEGGKGGGIPTTAKSTGSHCSGQVPPRAKYRDSKLGRPTACESTSNPCTMAACVGWPRFS